MLIRFRCILKAIRQIKYTFPELENTTSAFTDTTVTKNLTKPQSTKIQPDVRTLSCDAP